MSFLFLFYPQPLIQSVSATGSAGSVQGFPFTGAAATGSAASLVGGPFSRASSATYLDGTSNLITVGNDVLRPNFVSGIYQGPLIEAASTNGIANNTMVNAVAGTPGTNPSGWFSATQTGVSQQIVGTGTENGCYYIDYRFSGTPGATGNNNVIFVSATSIAALTGQTWSASVFVRLVGGSLTNITAVNQVIAEETSGGSFVTGQSFPFTPTTATLTTQQRSNTRTLSGGATVANVQSSLTIGVANGSAMDITLRIGMPQLEQASAVTSVITTTNAGAVTRAADVTSYTRASSASYLDVNGNLVTVASNVLRPNYVSGVYKGPLIEAAATNSIKNSTMVGAGAGSPGTLTTGWTTDLNNLTRTIIGTGVEDGITYIDIQYNGTSNNNYCDVNLGLITDVAASIGQTWSSSVYVKLVGGSLTNITSVTFFQQLYNNVPAFLGADGQPFTPTGASLSSQYITHIKTITTANTAYNYPYIKFLFNSSSAAINFTIRVGAPQLEQSPAPSSFIATTNAAATRAADIVSPTGMEALAAAATGASGTAQAGSLFVEDDIGIAGVEGDNQIGSLGCEVDTPLISIAGAGLAGSVDVEVDEALSLVGVAGSGQAASPSIEVDASSNGGTASGQAASLANEIDGTLLGAVSSGQAGLPAIEVDVSLAAVVGLGQSGSPSIEVDQTANIAGAVGAGQSGSTHTEIDESLSGIAGVGQAAAPVILIDEFLLAVSSAGQAGSPVADINVSSAAVGSGQAGSPLTKIDAALSGGVGTGQAASPTITISGTILGAGCTGQAGLPSIEVDKTVILVGVVGTGQGGSPHILVDTVLSGGAGTGLAASPAIEIDGTVLGVVGTGQAGSPSFQKNATASIAGVVATGQAAPSVAEEFISANIAAAGVAGTSASEIDIVDPAGQFEGVVGTGQAASPSFEGDRTTSLAGVVATAQAGSLSSNIVALAVGVAAVGSAGTLTLDAIIVVSLYSDNAGVPGTFITTIGSFPASEIGSSPTTIALSPSSPISLVPNTRYWVQVTNTLTTTVQWVTLANDGGTGVSTEFWYKSDGDSGSNPDGPVYQMAVLVEENIGLTGVEGVGGVGSVTTTTHSGRTYKLRSGRGAPYKAPDYTEPSDTEPLADKMARWRAVVADALELPDTPKDEEVVEAAVPSQPDFSFLSRLETVTQPRVDAEPIASIVQKSRYQMLAEAEDAMMLGVSEDDDFQLGLLDL